VGNAKRYSNASRGRIEIPIYALGEQDRAVEAGGKTLY